jgi:hypothetical protein
MKLTDFETQYLITALWSSTDWSSDDPLEDNYSISDFSEEAIKQAVKDCDLFIEKSGDLLDDIDDEEAGHDFWLTRNGHGSGFWAREYGEIGKKLTVICKEFSEIDLYVGDDKQLYFE